MTARILVVDDVPTNIRLLEAKLEVEYYQVLTAKDGEEALAVVAAEHPDLILLDVMMPGIDGYEVCRQLKSDPASSHIPVVMVTALADISDRIEGLEAGADDFLTKPINDTALFARVKSLLRLKMMHDELRLREDTNAQLGAILGDDVDGPATGRVLLIDDSRYDAEHFSRILKEAAYEVEVVEATAAALAAVGDAAYDLVAVSLDLKTDDPYRLISQFRSADETRHLPILLIQNPDETDRMAKGLELGASEYIIRPIDRHELLARIRSQLRRMQYERRLRDSLVQSVELAVTDPLTGLYNRRYFDAHFGSLIERAKETERPLALVMLDLDHFKAINDSHGHDVGDQVLRETARRITESVRAHDMVSRFGGEEFAIVIPDTTVEIAVGVAERLRAAIGQQPFEVEGSSKDEAITVTASLGIAVASRDPDATDLVKRADYALYAAKRGGRNQAYQFPEDTDLTATGSAA